jgi:hypothetical protein
MRIPKRWCETLLRWVTPGRGPDVEIGEKYLPRWYLIPRNPVLNVYLHHYKGPDDGRALHDHPWVSLSITLKGGYREFFSHAWEKGRYLDRRQGDVVFRRATAQHRIADPQKGTWTLFITGPRLRVWGFQIGPGHWIPHYIYTELSEADREALTARAQRIGGG